MIYLKRFETEENRIEFEESSVIKHVSYSLETNNVYVKAKKPYLTFDILSDGTVQFSGTSSTAITNMIQYSLDGGYTWSEPSQTVTLEVSAGDEIKWKGEMTPRHSLDGGIGRFSGGTAQFNVKYEIMSLLYGDDFETNDELNSTYAFTSLFEGSRVVHAAQLNLKSDTLTEFCYANMFKSCSELIEMPYLFAQNLANFCYFQMFQYCSSLTHTVALAAKTLKTSCYHRMFNGCTSLVKAPSLLALKMENSCYESMFGGCTSLTTPPILASVELADACYLGMFQGCTSLTSAPELLAIDDIPLSAYSYMFYGCTSLTESPKLRAINISKQRAYRYMFSGCTSLNYIYALFTTTPNNSDTSREYTLDWVKNVASNGLFVQNINASWGVSGTNYAEGSGLPSGWTVIYYDTSLKKYYTDKNRTQECDDHGNPIN